jgi:CHAT domain-containing protein
MPSRLTVQVLHQRGLAQLRALPEGARSRDWSAVSYSFVAAISILEQLRGHVLEVEESRWEVGENFSDLYALLIGCRFRSRDLKGVTPASRKLSDELMFRAAELSTARAFLRGLARSRADILAGLPQPLRQRRAELRQDLRDAEAALARAQSRPALERDFKEVARLTAQRSRLSRALEEWQAEVNRDHPKFADLESPRACSLEEGRSCLGKDEVALLYVLGAAESFVLVLEGDRPGELMAAPLPKAREIAEWVHEVVEPGRLSAVRPRDLEAEGYKMLLGPVADRIKGKHLVIVPTGELCNLPFELLVDRLDREKGTARFLAESHRIRYAPSLTVLRLIRQWQARRQRPDRTLWAVGDPVYEATDERVAGKGNLAIASKKVLEDYVARMRGGCSGTGVKIRYRRLPFSGAELEAIAKECGRGGAKGDCELLTGLEASEAAVKAASERGVLARYRYVHFATHGILGVDVGLQPSLVLSLAGNKAGERLAESGKDREDGFLQLDEVMRLRLNADLVVLSACETGRGRLYNGEGVRGLARAFLHAGSRGVVCSLWRVNDRETARLMGSLYAGLKSEPAAAALQAARVKLIRSGKPPLYWAPFIFIGE